MSQNYSVFVNKTAWCQILKILSIFDMHLRFVHDCLYYLYNLHFEILLYVVSTELKYQAFGLVKERNE